MQNIDCIEKTALMCPAINFCEIMERKSGISLDYFESNDYMRLYNDIKIYNKAYLEFKNGDNNIASKRVIEKNGGRLDIRSYTTQIGTSSSYIIAFDD